MFAKEIVIQNQVGLQARTATFFIQKANDYKSSIWVELGERRMNAKSLLGVLSLGIQKGMTITIGAEGSDEEKAVKDLIGKLFGLFRSCRNILHILLCILLRKFHEITSSRVCDFRFEFPFGHQRA